jgi:hypothetical protein
MGRKSRSKREFRAEVQAEMSRPRTRWEFVKEGIAFGIGMAVLLSLLVTLHSLARGTFHYEEYGVSTWAIVGAYCVAGASAGPLVGLLRGSAMRRSRAVMLGVAGGVIVYGVVAIVLSGQPGNQPSRRSWWVPWSAVSPDGGGPTRTIRGGPSRRAPAMAMRSSA